MNEVWLRVRAGGGVVARADNRDVSGQIDRLLRTGELVSFFPGVYGPPTLSDDADVQIRAAAFWAGPDAVVTGWAAARLTYWPAVRTGTVGLALPTTTKRSRAKVDVARRRIPPELVVERHGIPMTCPSLTAVDLCASLGGEAIDEVLRTRAASLDQLWASFAAQPGRDGNIERRRLLHDSRGNPWSEAERLAHRVLRAAGIRGWKGNRPVAGYWVDVVFPGARLILEIDGWLAHGDRVSFEEDRRRRNALVLAGYRVLNFTWRQLTEEQDWVVASVRTALRC